MASLSAAASVALEVREVGIERITSVFDDDNTEMMDYRMAKRVNLPSWMADIYQKLGHQVSTLGDAIEALKRASQDPRQTAPHLVCANEQMIKQQHELCTRTEQNVQQARREDFQTFEAASTQFADEMRLSMEFVKLSGEQQVAEKGRQTMELIEINARKNSEQWGKMEGWARGTNDQMATLRQQAAVSKESLDKMAWEMKEMKDKQAMVAAKQR